MGVEKRLQVYQCGKCGNIVMAMHAGGGTLVCCGQDMDLLEEKTADSATEKHVPVIEKIDEKVDGGVKVKVGSVPHPMEDKHFIEWIELQAGDAAYVQFLEPGGSPEAVFKTDAADPCAREFCNVHGLWKS